MDNTGYTTLARQSGLLAEMRTVANNIANMSTAGYRREGVIFSEFVHDLAPGQPSLSMAAGRVRATDLGQGALRQTGGTFDLAIEGEGFFLVETPQGPRLTRNGAFLSRPDGELTTAAGHRLLDAGGAPVFAPPTARAISIASDGTLSADGRPVAQIGLWTASSALEMERAAGAQFTPGDGPVPLEGGRILQGFLEDANVNPVTEIARMIAVQRAYEQGQTLLEREDERIRSVLRTLGR